MLWCAFSGGRRLWRQWESAQSQSRGCDSPWWSAAGWPAAVLPEPILKQVTAFNTREALLTEHLWTVTLDSQKILNIASKEDTNDVMPVNLFFRFTFSLFLSGYSWLFSTERGRKTSGTLEMKGLWSPLSVSCIHDLKKIMLPRIASPVYTVYIIFLAISEEMQLML